MSAKLCDLHYPIRDNNDVSKKGLKTFNKAKFELKHIRNLCLDSYLINVVLLFLRNIKFLLCD